MTVTNKANPMEVAEAISQVLIAKPPTWPNYTTDLCLEALLCQYAAVSDTRCLDHVLAVWDFRGKPRNSLTIGNSAFTNIHLETWKYTRDSRFIEGLVDFAYEWMRFAPRTSECVVSHRTSSQDGVLIDMLAGYAPLMAAAGNLSGDHAFYEECLRQISLYHDLFEDSTSGLWHHATGWNAPDFLSPSGWCRGQGWVMRAIVKSLEWMSDFGTLPLSSVSQADILQKILQILTEALLRYQQPSGMWHQLVDEPDSYPETSGTGFIASSLQIASRNGWIDGYSAAICATRALTSFVTPEGIVRGGCPGTPPLATRTGYRQWGPNEGDLHATAGVLMALAEIEK